MKSLWRIFRTFLAIIGFVVLALAVFGAASLGRSSPQKLPEKIVLVYTFYGTPADAPPGPSWLSYIMPQEPTLAEVTNALYKSVNDKRVEALAVNLAAGHYNWADVQELRAAILAFKGAGKKAYVYSESYGELYPGMAEYYLASAFDEIWLQPVGSVAITGFQAEAPYFKQTLEKIGVQPDIIQKGDYKTAPESALLDHMSEQQRQTLHGILSSMMTDFFEGVSQGRKLEAARIGQLIDGAPYTAEEAKERKLIDRVGYVDELIAQLVPDTKKKDKDFVNAVDYLYDTSSGGMFDQVVKKEQKLTDKTHKKDSVALIYITGMILSDPGPGGGSPFGDRMAYASDIAGAIDEATQDDDIAAIVLRVDSPGGSPSASETIRRAVEVAKAKGKYVVVSMGSEAASGGYWVVVDADRIFAQPGTLTGSIGVFGGKASFAGLWEKIGVNWDSVSMGGNAGLWSPNKGYDAQGRAAISRMLDDVYDAFIERVAKGRKFAPDVVESMAGGRVWTGRQAKDRGLIDEIGGLHQVLGDVATEIGVSGPEKLNIVVLPAEKSPFEGLFGMFSGGAHILSPVLESLALMAHPEAGITHYRGFAIRP